MKKVSKKLQLNKQVVANLNSVFGGEATKTWNCASKECASAATNPGCPQPTNTCNFCNSNKTIKDGSGCIWTTDYTCTPTNGGCTTHNACSLAWC